MCLVLVTDTIWVLLISALLPQDPEAVLGHFHPLGSFQSQALVSTGGCTLPRSYHQPACTVVYRCPWSWRIRTRNNSANERHGLVVKTPAPLPTDGQCWGYVQHRQGASAELRSWALVVHRYSLQQKTLSGDSPLSPVSSLTTLPEMNSPTHKKRIEKNCTQFFVTVPILGGWT